MPRELIQPAFPAFGLGEGTRNAAIIAGGMQACWKTDTGAAGVYLNDKRVGSVWCQPYPRCLRSVAGGEN